MRTFLSPGCVTLMLVFSMVGCVGRVVPKKNEKVHRDLVFASPGGHDLRLDLYVPETKEPAPVVIWLFGGSWKFGWKNIHVVLRDLTRHGIAVASIEYRYSKDAPFPAQLEDARAAVEWLQKHGTAHGVDGSRIGVSGESAGAHLAALLGVVDGPPDILAVCVLSPPANLISLHQKHAWTGNQTIPNLLRGRLPARNDLAWEASPTFQVREGSSPFLILHGRHDFIVPPGQSEEFHAALRKHGVESTLRILPNKWHWFRLNRSQIFTVAEFFNKHLK